MNPKKVEAAIKAIDLPPIKVYELAGLYFVRDGNHRVSVAKARGVEMKMSKVALIVSAILLPIAPVNIVALSLIQHKINKLYA